MRAGLAQMDILWENVQKNKKKAEDFIKKAKEYDVELLAFPEMSLTGFSMQVEKTTADWKEQRHFFEEMSGRYEMTIAFGYPAPSSGPMCRNHLAVAENGRIRMDYEKIHPFTFGQEGAHFEGRGAHFLYGMEELPCSGGFICYDLRFPRKSFRSAPGRARSSSSSQLAGEPDRGLGLPAAGESHRKPGVYPRRQPGGRGRRHRL